MASERNSIERNSIERSSTDILETDAEKVSKEVISDVERTTGILMAGDERRILLDLASYAIVHQNVVASVGFDALDIDNAIGERLTARGRALGLERSVGQPARLRLRFRVGTELTIPRGTAVLFDGCRFLLDADCSGGGRHGSYIFGTGTSDTISPDETQTVAQNGLNPWTHSDSGRLETPIPYVLSAGVAREDRAYLQYAVARDTDNDDLFRKRCNDMLTRNGDYERLVRSLLPDATDVLCVNGGAGIVDVMAVHRDMDGYAKSYSEDVKAIAEVYLNEPSRRLQGDVVRFIVPTEVAPEVNLAVVCARGASSQVQTRIQEGLKEFCRSYSSIGGRFDLGDVVRWVDGLEGVEYVNVTATAGSTATATGKRFHGNPSVLDLQDGEYVRLTPASFSLSYSEVER